MTPEIWTTIIVGLTILAAVVPALLHLSNRIDNLSNRMDKQNERVGALEQSVAALKATVETYFRVRIDKPPPPPPPQDRQDEAA